MFDAPGDSGRFVRRNGERFCREGGKREIEFLLFLRSSLDLHGDGSGRDFARTVGENGCVQFPDDESPTGFDTFKRRRADKLGVLARLNGKFRQRASPRGADFRGNADGRADGNIASGGQLRGFCYFCAVGGEGALTVFDRGCDSGSGGAEHEEQKKEQHAPYKFL